MKDIFIYIGAAFFEILGCFLFWNYFRLGKSVYLLIPAIISLSLFAYLLTLVQAEFAGRAYAIYGGIYIAASLVWLFFAEGQTPDKWDLIGASVCILGALIILYAPR